MWSCERRAPRTAWDSRSPPPGARWVPSGVRTFTSAPELSGRYAAVVALWVAEHSPRGEVGGAVRTGGELSLDDRIEDLHLGVQVRPGHGRHAHPQHVGTGGVGLTDERAHSLPVLGAPTGCAVGGRAVGTFEGLGIVGPHHHHHQLRPLVGQVDAELGRPVEVVGPRQAGVDPAVEAGRHHPGGGQVGDEGLAEVDPDRVTDDQHPQRIGGGGVLVERRRERGRRPGRSGRSARPRPRRVVCVPGGQGRADPGGESRAAARGAAEHLVGPAHHVGEPEAAAESGDGPDGVEGHRPAGTEGGDRRRALEARGVEEEPDGEADHPDEQHPGPADAAGRRRHRPPAPAPDGVVRRSRRAVAAAPRGVPLGGGARGRERIRDDRRVRRGTGSLAVGLLGEAGRAAGAGLGRGRDGVHAGALRTGSR